MRVTEVLLRLKKRMPKGHIWRGKERLYREVTPLIAANARVEFQREEKNMFYLRHPYMTREQEIGHAKPFNHREKFFDKHITKSLENWRPHKLLGDRFGFLKVADKWE